MEGTHQIFWIRIPEDMQSDLSHCPFLNFFYSSFLTFPVSVDKLDWRRGKIESCYTWITHSADALLHQQVVRVPTQ